MAKGRSSKVRERMARNSKMFHRRATPDARERIPPMGVVKRGLWAWRLFHFFNATESRYYGDAQSAHLPQCSATQASGPTRISRKDFALQSPSNPKRTPLRVAPPESLFRITPKATLFFKRSTAPL